MDDRNVALVGIGVEFLGVEEFEKEGFFTGNLLVDEGKKLYNYLETSRTNLFSLMKPSVISSILRANNAGFSGNTVGDGLQLGGTFIFDCKNGEMLFSHHQTHFGDHPDLEAVKAVLIDNFDVKEQKEEDEES
eukprot:CAMPEP_0174251962 /NCGR_PEP_ID=MMETSP0439-20130205/1627_1 /TAXON_ID=0 /ORGANISM="Stereomyxa ramosa, Strain Chinc5" /LENGTH=132 /DNA_ID=CAMNT_0015332421 /DNA_START=295 /DNA_END=693 /DNA_ORIENTATION=+